MPQKRLRISRFWRRSTWYLCLGVTLVMVLLNLTLRSPAPRICQFESVVQVGTDPYTDSTDRTAIGDLKGDAFHRDIKDTLDGLSKYAPCKSITTPEIIKLEGSKLYFLNTTVKGLYMLSAHYDVRDILEDQPSVRVLAIHRKDIAIGNIYCQLWYSQFTDMLSSKAYVVKLTNSKHPDDKYEEFLVNCPTFMSHLFPAAVTLSSLECSTSDRALPVYIPVWKPAKYDIGICAVPIQDDVNPHRVMEWVELHRQFGVKHMTLYRTPDLDKLTVVVLDHYEAEYTVETIQISGAPDVIDFTSWTDFSNFANIFYHDCLFRNMFRYKYIANLSPNDVIVPTDLSNFKILLKILSEFAKTNPSANMFFFHSHSFKTQDRPSLQAAGVDTNVAAVTPYNLDINTKVCIVRPKLMLWNEEDIYINKTQEQFQQNRANINPFTLNSKITMVHSFNQCLAMFQSCDSLLKISLPERSKTDKKLAELEETIVQRVEDRVNVLQQQMEWAKRS